MRRLQIDPAIPDAEVVEESARVIQAGGLVALPTDTLYGVAADPFNPQAVARLFSAKGRSARQPIALVAADLDQVVAWFGALSAAATRLAARFWPGPLTLLLSSPNGLAEGIASDDGLVGVRVAAHAVPRALCARCGRPLTATSANRSGQPAPSDADAVERELGPVLDLLLDGGPSPGGYASTIVDVTGRDLRLIRSGAIAWDAILASLE